MRKFFRFLIVVLVPVSMVLILSCGEKKECEGCEDSAPWSNPDAEYCYPSREACEDNIPAEATDDKCYRCN